MSIRFWSAGQVHSRNDTVCTCTAVSLVALNVVHDHIMMSPLCQGHRACLQVASSPADVMRLLHSSAGAAGAPGPQRDAVLVVIEPTRRTRTKGEIELPSIAGDGKHAAPGSTAAIQANGMGKGADGSSLSLASNSDDDNGSTSGMIDQQSAEGRSETSRQVIIFCAKCGKPSAM